MTERADVIVLGLGVAGEVVAGDLAEAGRRVIGIEAGLVGGECPYWGCVPTKMMVRAANLLTEARRVPDLAGACAVVPAWEPVAARIRDEATDDWDDRVAVERLEGKGARFVRGVGRFVAPGAVTVGDDRFEAPAVVVATGTEPVIPPVPGLDTVDAWTNRDAVRVEVLPESLLVLGGGAVGCELAQVFARFGVAVTILEAAPRLLAHEEPEAGEVVEAVLGGEGAVVHTGVTVTEARAAGAGVEVALDDGRRLTAARLLVATGRRADLDAIDAAAAGIEPEDGWIRVDDRMRAAPGVWAVGDVTGAGLFTHVAVHQARRAVDDLLGLPPDTASHPIPRVTFTDPEVGSVGQSEREARDAGLDVRVGLARVPSSARGWIHGAGNEGFVKLVGDATEGVLVGATVAGPTGGEVIGMLTLAIDQRIPVAALRKMVYAYPTFHRAVEDALRDLGS